MAKSETAKIDGEELISYLMERFKCSEKEVIRLLKLEQEEQFDSAMRRARVSAKNKSE